MRHKDKVVRITDHVEPGWPAMLIGHEFQDCVIRGPAVLLLSGPELAFDGCELSSEMFWEVQTDRAYIGGIGLERCRFRGCTFEGVGIAADRETIDT